MIDDSPMNDMSIMIACVSVSKILRNLTVSFQIASTSLESTHVFFSRDSNIANAPEMLHFRGVASHVNCRVRAKLYLCTCGAPDGAQEHAVAQLVEALRYKSEGRGFDSRWCRWNYSLTLALGLTQPLTEMSTRNTS
jgi:hypothetical protein